jgi:hypothetical protein
MTQSTEAMMDSGELLTYLTTAKISDGSWRGTTKIFVLNWIDKLYLYHELTPVADCLSENTQRTLLQNAVIGLNPMRQVQINSDLQQATHGTALMFAQYRTLLINLATVYDKQSDKPNSKGKPHCLVFKSETLFGDHDKTLEFDYGVDTMADELQAYALNQWERPQFKSGSRMLSQSKPNRFGIRWMMMTKPSFLPYSRKERKDRSQVNPSSPSTRTLPP